MTYVSRVNKRRGQGSWLKIAMGIFVMLFLLLYFFNHFFGGIVVAIGRPIWPIINSIESSNILAGFKSKTNLEAENQDLREKLINLQNKQISVDALENENASLKDILGRKNNQKLLLGAILVWPPYSPYDTLIIDVGAENGVKVGEMVLASGDLAVGQIAAIYNSTSVVRLFSSGGEKHQVIIGTSTKAEAVGKGGENFQLSLPAGTLINIGDTVQWPGPNPLILGNIEAVDTPNNSSFLQAYFKLPVNLATINYLEVVMQ